MAVVRFFFLLKALLLLGVCSTLVIANPVPLIRAYAHNDEQNADPPLVSALDNGFCNVEVDVNLLDNQLIIGHDCLYPWSRCDELLSDTYLTPLTKAFVANKGYIQPGALKLGVCTEFTFVIDVKTEASSSYSALSKLLAEYDATYPGFLTVFANDTVLRQGAVTVLVSGYRISPEEIAREPIRYASLDGRIPENIDDQWPSAVIGWLSQNWSTLFDTTTVPFSATTCDTIRDYVAKAHRKGQRVRFWAIPEDEAFWGELLRCGVDIINLDNYVRGKTWLLA